MLICRNLVSALLHHETIKTTLPKAKETARLAEKVGQLSDWEAELTGRSSRWARRVQIRHTARPWLSSW